MTVRDLSRGDRQAAAAVTPTQYQLNTTSCSDATYWSLSSGEEEDVVLVYHSSTSVTECEINFAGRATTVLCHKNRCTECQSITDANYRYNNATDRGGCFAAHEPFQNGEGQRAAEVVVRSELWLDGKAYSIVPTVPV